MLRSPRNSPHDEGERSRDVFVCVRFAVFGTE